VEATQGNARTTIDARAPGSGCTSGNQYAQSAGDLMCEHFHESASRYDAIAKLLTLLLVCPECGIERVIDTIPYEPKFVPTRPLTLA
jgi:hypothetical protein